MWVLNDEHLDLKGHITVTENNILKLGILYRANEVLDARPLKDIYFMSLS